MLKIKDEIDLKELEKYGLILKYECDTKTGDVWVSEVYRLTRPGSCLYSIVFYTENQKDLLLGNIDKKGSLILYDLINDGLVEKV